MSSSIANASLGARLESYTLKWPQEVLLVQAVVEGEADTIIIFKGFSSSLVRPTAYDPEIPTIPAGTEIISIDRLRGPYQPEMPDYIEQSIALDTFERKMAANGL